MKKHTGKKGFQMTVVNWIVAILLLLVMLFLIKGIWDYIINNRLIG